MRFAICNELFQDWDIHRSLELTAQCDYTGWEIAPFTLGPDPIGTSDSQRRSLVDAIKSHGIDIVGLHWLLAKTEGFHLTTNDASVRKATAQYLQQLTRLCRDLDGSIMVLGSPQQRNFPPEMTHAQADDNALEVLEQLVPTLEENKVTLALEPLGPGEGNYWNEASQAVQVIERLDSPWIRLHLDVKAMSTESKPIEEVIRDEAKYMAHFHANDPNLLGPGMGEVEFAPIFKALQDVDYKGWVSVEVFDYSPGIETIARESMANMKRALASTLP